MNKNKTLELIKEIDLMINSHFEKISSLITNNKLKQLSDLYRKNNRQKNELGFNIFKIISETFYKENFHSDILKALLEIPEILNEFLDLVKNKNIHLDISNKDYNNSIIEREKGRIDVSVKDNLTKKAIIIENKINNAQDTERQLPKYKEYLEANGFTAEAIVYLSLDGSKIPNKGDWSDEEKKEINKKLVLIGAYNETDYDIYSMLQSCESLITDIDILLLIRQYKQLIKFLGRSNMNKPIMKQFFETVLNVDNFETAITISDMLQDLGKYRAIRLKDEFGDNPSPFEKVDIWRDNTAYFHNLAFGDSNFAIDIYCDTNEYSVQFFDRNSYDNQSAIDFIRDLDCNFNEKKDNSRLYKFFKFPEEENEVYDFIKEFKEKLNNAKKN